MYGEKIEDILYHITSLVETLKVKPGVVPPVAVKFFYNANTILKCLEFCEFNNCKKSIQCLVDDVHYWQNL